MQIPPLQQSITAEVTKSARLLQAARPLNGEKVHESRKALKRARAGLRLLRNATTESFYVRHNARLRDAAKPLGQLRDEVVLLDKAGDMLHKTKGGRDQKLIAALQHRIETDCRRLHGEAREKRLPHKSAQELAKIADDINSQALASSDSTAMFSGFERIYRKGRAAVKAAAKRSTDENLHEARKQAKYLFHALQFVEKVGGARTKKFSKRADAVGQKLGDDHDLVLLEARLAVVAPGQASAARKHLSSRLARQRKKLQKKALRKAKPLYAMKPKAFVSLLEPEKA